MCLFVYPTFKMIIQNNTYFKKQMLDLKQSISWPIFLKSNMNKWHCKIGKMWVCTKILMQKIKAVLNEKIIYERCKFF